MADDAAPLPNRILDAAEAALRRFGVDKTNVVDIAKALGMSHANVYRHFPSKKALLNAVAQRWLTRVTEPLAAVVSDGSRPPPQRLADWFDTLIRIKRHKVLDDPELFRAYHGIAEANMAGVHEHISALVAQLAQIVEAGVASGDFAPQPDPVATARGLLLATAAFHHPAMVAREPRPTDADVKAVVTLLLAGLGKL